MIDQSDQHACLPVPPGVLRHLAIEAVVKHKDDMAAIGHVMQATNGKANPVDARAAVMSARLDAALDEVDAHLEAAGRSPWAGVRVHHAPAPSLLGADSDVWECVVGGYVNYVPPPREVRIVFPSTAPARARVASWLWQAVQSYL